MNLGNRQLFPIESDRLVLLQSPEPREASQSYQHGEPPQLLCLASFLETFVHSALHAFQVYPAENFAEEVLQACATCLHGSGGGSRQAQEEATSQGEMFIGTPEAYDSADERGPVLMCDDSEQIQTPSQKASQIELPSYQVHRCTLPTVQQHIQRTICAYLLFGDELQGSDSEKDLSIRKIAMQRVRGLGPKEALRPCCAHTLYFHARHRKAALLHCLRVRVAPLLFVSLELQNPFHLASVMFICEPSPSPVRCSPSSTPLRGEGTEMDPIRFSAGSAKKVRLGGNVIEGVHSVCTVHHSVRTECCCSSTSMFIDIVAANGVFTELQKEKGSKSIAQQNQPKKIKVSEANPEDNEEYQRYCKHVWGDLDVASLFPSVLIPEPPPVPIWEQFAPAEPAYDIVIDIKAHTALCPPLVRSAITRSSFYEFDLEKGKDEARLSADYSIESESCDQMRETAKSHCNRTFGAHPSLDSYCAHLPAEVIKKLYVDSEPMESAPVDVRALVESQSTLEADEVFSGASNVSEKADDTCGKLLCFRPLWEDNGLLLSVVGLDADIVG